MAIRAAASGDYLIRTAGGFYAQSVMTVCFWLMLETDKNASGCAWGVRDTGSGFGYVYFYDTVGDGTSYGWEGSSQIDITALALNTWTFIALSRTGTGSNQTTAYRRTATATSLTSVNGTLGDSIAHNEEICLSNGFNTSGGYFPGKIAALKQWDAALSAAELWEESQRLTPVRLANLHSWRPMVDGTVAGSAKDYSSNARDLTANGALTVSDGPPVVWRQGMRRIFIPAAAGGPLTLTVGGSVTPTGALIKQIGKPLSGAVTPSGAFLKSLARALSGAITPTGALLKQANKPLSGTVTPAGAILKITQKPLTGSVTPSGALSTVKVILRSFVGAITPAGALVRNAAKTLSGVVTPAGAILKSASKALSGSISPVGSIAKLIGKLFSGIVTLAGNVINFVAGSPLSSVTATITDQVVTSATLGDSRVTAAALSDQALTICNISDEIGG